MPIKCHNRVLLLLACIAIAAVALPFVNVAPNRLMSGEGRAVWQIWPYTPVLLAAALGVPAALSFWPARRAQWLTLILCEALFIVLVWSAGLAASQMVSVESPSRGPPLAAGFGCGWRCVCWPAAISFAD